MRSYLPSIGTLKLYVPTGALRATIIKGSAVVGQPSPDYVDCYYEGGRYQSMSFEEKLNSAAGRLVERYATVARVRAPLETVIEVGTITWDPMLTTWVVSEITDPETLKEWAGELPVTNGTRSQKERGAERLLRGPKRKIAAKALAKAQASGQDPVEAILATVRNSENESG